MLKQLQWDLDTPNIRNSEGFAPQELLDAAGVMGMQTTFFCSCERTLSLAKFTTRMLLQDAKLSDADALTQTLKIVHKVNGWEPCGFVFRAAYFYYRSKAIHIHHDKTRIQLERDEQILKDQLIKDSTQQVMI